VNMLNKRSRSKDKECSSSMVVGRGTKNLSPSLGLGQIILITDLSDEMELHNLYSSPSIIKIIKSRRMR
jgi:hypothetical protein